MNDFGVNYNKSVIHSIDMNIGFLKDLKQKASDFRQNVHSDFTDYDRSTIAAACECLDKAIEQCQNAYYTLKILT